MLATLAVAAMVAVVAVNVWIIIEVRKATK
jgi:hypothetical protein